MCEIDHLSVRPFVTCCPLRYKTMFIPVLLGNLIKTSKVN